MKNAYIPSRSIRKIPHLSTLLPEFHICKDGKGAEAVVGWGLRLTTHKARAFAAEHQLPFIALEDGFYARSAWESPVIPPTPSSMTTSASTTTPHVLRVWNN
nr:hypothetical protein [Neisseria subflava]